MDLRTSLAALYRNLVEAAVDGVVQPAAFEAEVADLGLDDTARARLLCELDRMGLRLDTSVVQFSTTSDSQDVKKVVRPRTSTTQTGGATRSRVRTALNLVARYSADGSVPERVVVGAARLAGLTGTESAELRAAAAARFTVVADVVAVSTRAATSPRSEAVPGALDTGTPPAPALPVPSAEAGAPTLPEDGDIDRAVSAALTLLEEDRFNVRPDKRILLADEEVGLSVLLRGGPDRIGVEPTAEELAQLPATHVRRRARDCFAAHNQRLVHSVVRAYIGQGLDYEDLYQHGTLGLIKATRKYDPRQGNKFSTYATWWVRQTATRAVAGEGSPIRIPVHMHEQVRKVARVERELLSAGRSRSAAAVAVACEMSITKVEEIRRISRVTDSLDRIIGDGAHLGELITARTALPSVEGAVLQSCADRNVHDLVALLPERYAHVVNRRIGLDDEEPATLDVIGAELGVTRERVRQLESQVFAVLRFALEATAADPITALNRMLAAAQSGNPVSSVSKALRNSQWRAGVDAMRSFHAREGHARPSHDHLEDGFPLGRWAAEQRAEAGETGDRIPAQRKVILSLVGFRWDAPKLAAKRKHEALKRRRELRQRALARAVQRRALLLPPVSDAAEPEEPEETGTSNASPTLATGPQGSGLAAEKKPDAHTPAPQTHPDEPELRPETEPTAAPKPESGAEPESELNPQSVRPAEEPAARQAEAHELYTGRWEDAVELSVTLNRSVRWMAHYVHLALGHLLLGEILGLYPALTVAKVAGGDQLPDRPVTQALEVLVKVLDSLKERRLRPEDFFECPSPALLGRSPRAYLATHPLVKPEGRLALSQALKEFEPSRPGTSGSETEPEPGVDPARTDVQPQEAVQPPAAPEPVDSAAQVALDEAQAAATHVESRLLALEADVGRRIARARAEERNRALAEAHAVQQRAQSGVAAQIAAARAEERDRARAQAEAETLETVQRMKAELAATVAEEAARARADERNKARAEAQADVARQVAEARREAELRTAGARREAELQAAEAQESAEERARQAHGDALRQMEREYADRIRQVEEASRRQLAALEERLQEAEAAFAERVEAAQALEHEATERVQAVERWAERRVAEVQEAARARIAELAAGAMTPGPVPTPPPAEPQGPDPRRWWRRG
ncbi:sigma-70 family RNA polymerase sigma factor [Streptomyces peucetius]|uniref:Sigma-70 family RNA polymerase sigma factor n=1 Tax=Streptomyces peucetius TaxID=1950 RepID=A0ABY6IF28_STRPE|nr:sigma-70 family RNA polymerase sigma factor [Streptomyces peucetius]UYQ65609.1 sigma-70 family RNA polymerase sigma factor [Streptomyces peucetius]